MALQYVGGNSGNSLDDTTTTVSLTALTGGIGSAALTGDIVIVAVGNGANADLNASISSPTGYSSPLCNLYANDSYDSNLSVFWKIMGVTPDTNVVTTGNSGSASNTNSTVVHVWRNIDSSTPIDVTTTGTTGKDGNQGNSPSISPTTSGAIVLSIVACGHSSTQNPTAAAPSGYSNLIYLDKSGVTRCIITAIASKVWSGSGAEDPGAFTIDPDGGSATSWCGATVVLRPSIAAGPANLKTYNTNLKANIKTINTNPIANVKSLNTNV